VFLAERAAELLQENIITDRTVIDVMAFTSLADSIDYPELDDFENLASRFIEDYDYIFYVSPEGVDIEDNGVRETDAKYRDLVDFSINKFLDRYSWKIKNLIKLKGTTEERIESFKEALLPQYL